jgi:Methyltransferase domain
MNSFSPETNQTLPPSAAVYSRLMLSVYDILVLGISNRFAWGCPTQHILHLYQRGISNNHLDIGVGTGYFLDRVQFPSENPSVHLMDINPTALDRTADRIKRLRPICMLADATQAEHVLEKRYDSIAINYLLHCLAGPMPEKGSQLLARLIDFLEPSGGRLFGATILGDGVQHNAFGKKLMTLYNRNGIFGNQSDSEEQLRSVLASHFERYEIEIQGCVALFTGYRDGSKVAKKPE